MPNFYLQEHSVLLEEFQNSTHWPKHLLVRYHWTHNSALNVNAAMFVLFGVGKCEQTDHLMCSSDPWHCKYVLYWQVDVESPPTLPWSLQGHQSVHAR